MDPTLDYSRKYCDGVSEEYFASGSDEEGRMDEKTPHGSPRNGDADDVRELPNQGAIRRRLLLGGGFAAASAVVSVRPAIAQTVASVMHCQIPVPDPASAGNYIAADGSIVPHGTEGAFPAAGRPFTGEEVKAALRGGRSLPGASHEQSRAYLNYIRRLQTGSSGFTCYASLQMPR
jgi:hypothetical protein